MTTLEAPGLAADLSVRVGGLVLVTQPGACQVGTDPEGFALARYVSAGDEHRQGRVRGGRQNHTRVL